MTDGRTECSGQAFGFESPDETTAPPLAGFTVGVTANRNSAVLGSALERFGARVVFGPAIRLVEPMTDARLRDVSRELVADRLDVLIATTGRGFRAWMAAISGWGLAEATREALAAARIVCRSEAAAGAVADYGLCSSWTTRTSSWAEVLAYLAAHDLIQGRRIAVQLHGEPIHGMVEALRVHHADVVEVPVYRWLPPERDAPLRRVIAAAAAQTIDALAFTSAPAATSFLRTADRLGLLADVTAALSSTVLCACVGPVTAAPLLDAGIPVVLPARARLGALAREIVERVPRRAPLLKVAGHELELRGYATVVDDVLMPLPAGSMALLRELARRPGQVLSRDVLATLLPGESSDGHAVEVAIARLRLALGDPAMVQTVVKRGYRLSVDGEPVGSRVAALH